MTQPPLQRPRTPLLALGLALAAFAGCQDSHLPTSLTEAVGAAFNLAPGHCVVTTTNDGGEGSLRAAILDEACFQRG
jgi:hypothetical protein